ncbi:mechanosensitive ion channel [Halorubrum sp. AD140]|uniref:mechanosensitive ion channel domain-containing protein n=1 Tax=Halorubrum sp. AD140 TaxID=3050073 RepID=UPI002ACC9BA7|nr:mechanosensitive ion channel domain-containing protein [Halorubrum sp. AD140]MDZ5811488.1 mechanosensitive ion channel [Halorubrum sp. AD140]
MTRSEGVEPISGQILAPVTSALSRLSELPGSGLVLLLLSVAVGAVVSKFLVRLIGRPVARRVSRQSVAQTIVRGVRVGTIFFALLIGLRAGGFRFTDLLVGTAVFSAVIGIILAPLVGNFINGVFILADQPFEIGDMIELENGTTGFVDDITIRYTKIFTLDNTFLVVPNGTMRERDVTNFSAEDERTRRTIEVLVTYESDISEARRLIERAARDCDAVIDGGPDIRIGVARYTASPDCRLHEFGDDGVLLRLRYWVKKPYKLAKVQSDVNTRVRERLADADVEMAYPHRHLVFDDTSGIARIGGPEDGRPAGERAGDKPGGGGRRDDESSPEGTSDTEASGEEASGTEASGEEASGTEASGGEASGDEASGGEASGDEASGDEASTTDAASDIRDGRLDADHVDGRNRNPD